MGLPSSSILTELVMTNLLDINIPTLLFALPFLYFYAHDMFMAVPFDMVDTFVYAFIGYNPNL